MFKIGDYVVHSGHGVCLIVDKIFDSNLHKDFYKLQTIHNNMSIKMPCDKANSLLRSILSKEDLAKIMNEAILLSDEYIKDNKERKNKFQTLIMSNDINDTILLLKSLYHLSDDKKKEKKTLGSFDTQFLQQAERKLFNEVAIAIGISSLEAKDYVYEHLKVTKVI